MKPVKDVGSISQQLITLRKKAGWTQQRCADIVDCSRRTWQYWESGENEIPKAYLHFFEWKANEQFKRRKK